MVALALAIQCELSQECGDTPFGCGLFRTRGFKAHTWRAEAEELPLSEAERCRQRLPTASPPPAVPPSQAGGNADDAASEESQARAHVSAAAAEVEQAVQQEAVEKAVQEAMQENSAAARVSTWAALASAMDGGGKFLFQLPLRFNDPIWIPIVDLN